MPVWSFWSSSDERGIAMEQLRAALAEIAAMHRDGLLTDDEVRATSLSVRCMLMSSVRTARMSEYFLFIFLPSPIFDGWHRRQSSRRRSWAP